MAKLNREYFYKTTRYTVVTKSVMMKANGKWASSVGYKETENKDNPDATLYIREEAEFNQLFLPTALEVGDYIVGYSMARPRSKYQVDEIRDGDSGEKIAVAVPTSKTGSQQRMQFLADITENEPLTVISYESGEPTEQATDYYYQMENLDECLKNNTLIRDMSAMLSDAAERVKKISRYTPSHYLEEAKESVTETLGYVYGRFDV